MSNYRAPAFHPVTGKVEEADWLDNHFGHRIYGVRFNDGTLCHTYEVGLEAAAKMIERQRKALRDIAYYPWIGEKDWTAIRSLAKSAISSTDGDQDRKP